MQILRNVLISFLTFLAVFEASVADEGGFLNPVQSTTIVSEGLHTTNSDAPIEDAYRDIFGSNVYHLSQQTMQKLLPFAEMKGMVRNSMSIDRIGTLGMPAKYLSRGSKVHGTNPENDVRWLEAERFWLACFIDNYDQIRTLWNIRNAYTEAMARSFGRLYERVFIAAALGTASTGAPNSKTGDATLPTTQKFIATSKNLNPASTSFGQVTAGTGLKIHTLAQVKQHMKETFAIQAGEMAVMAINAAQVTSLLEEVQVTSRDYQNLSPLMNGELAQFYGFVFAETQLIPAMAEAFRYTSPVANVTTGQLVDSGGTAVNATEAAKYDRCFAFTAGSAICFGINMNILSRISERDDLHYNAQLYYASEFGAVRREEVKVVEVLCKSRA